MLSNGPRHWKTCLRPYADSEGPYHLCIRAVWPGPSPSAAIIIEHYRMYQWRANARIMRMIRNHTFCACSTRSKLCLSAMKLGMQAFGIRRFIILKLIMLGKNFSRRHFDIFFLFSTENRLKTFHANCLLVWWDTSLFSEGKKKKKKKKKRRKNMDLSSAALVQSGKG